MPPPFVFPVKSTYREPIHSYDYIVIIHITVVIISTFTTEVHVLLYPAKFKLSYILGNEAGDLLTCVTQDLEFTISFSGNFTLNEVPENNSNEQSQSMH